VKLEKIDCKFDEKCAGLSAGFPGKGNKNENSMNL
jgi:hypothetical protein